MSRGSFSQRFCLFAFVVALTLPAVVAMAQTAPPPKPKREEVEEAKPPPKPRVIDRSDAPLPAPVLLISADLDCTLELDGAVISELQKDIVQRLQITPGEHLLQAFAMGVEGGPTWKGELKAPATGTVVETIELKELVEEWKEEMASLDRFDVNSATVLDNDTGLLWTKNVSHEMRYEETSNYCSSLRLDGVGGWRMPTLNEASSLYYPDHPAPTQEPCRGEPARVLFLKSKAEIEVMPRMIFEVLEHNSVCSIWVLGQEDRVSCTFLGEFNCAKEKKKHQASVFCVTDATMPQ